MVGSESVGCEVDRYCGACDKWEEGGAMGSIDWRQEENFKLAFP